jgi:hypothetical protein
LVSLSQDADTVSLLSKCVSAADWSMNLSPYHINASYSSLKSKVSYLLPAQPDETLSLLDLAKAVDCLLLTIQVNEGCKRAIIDNNALDFIAALKAAGMPDIIVCVQGLDAISGKVLHATKREMQRILDAAIYDGMKIKRKQK